MRHSVLTGSLLDVQPVYLGGRKGPVPSALPDGVDEVREGNDHVGKAYWPEILEKSGSNKMRYKRW